VDPVGQRVEGSLRQIRQPDEHSLLGDRLAFEMANK